MNLRAMLWLLPLLISGEAIKGRLAAIEGRLEAIEGRLKSEGLPVGIDSREVIRVQEVNALVEAAAEAIQATNAPAIPVADRGVIPGLGSREVIPVAKAPANTITEATAKAPAKAPAIPVTEAAGQPTTARGANKSATTIDLSAFTIASSDFREEPGAKDNCFYVTMKLGGDHSEHRADTALKWMTDVALASVDLAAAETESNVVVILSLTDTYEGMSARVDPLKFPHVTLYLPHLNDAELYSDLALDEVTELVMDGGCKRATFVRIDADDVLSPSYLKRINLDVSDRDAIERGSIFNLGAHHMEQIILGWHEDGSLACELRHQPEYEEDSSGRRSGYKHYQYSQGQAVSILVDDWLNYMPGMYTFGNHTMVEHHLSDLVERKIKVEAVTVVNPAYYMMTSLSGHYHYGVYSNNLPPRCELSKVTTDPLIEKLLRDNIDAVPRLTDAEQNENHFIVNHQIKSIPVTN